MTPFEPVAGRSFTEALVEPFRDFVDPDKHLDRRTRRTHATLAMRAYYARLEHSAVTGDDDDHPSHCREAWVWRRSPR